MKRCVLLVCILLLCSAVAHAREFDTEIIVDSIEDLYAYEERGELTLADVETLSGFLVRPLDLNRADRNILFELPGISNVLASAIIRYRAENGDFDSVDALGNVPGVQEIILLQVRPFLTISELAPEEPEGFLEESGLTGTFRTGMQYRTGFIAPWDDLEREIDEVEERELGPQGYLQLAGNGFTYFGAGALLTYRRGIDIDFDPTAFEGGTFVSAAGPNNRVRFDQAYLTSTYGGVNVILGSYTAGFGERVTFNTSRYQLPNGWYPNVVFTEDNERGAVRIRDRLFGIAVQYDGFNLGPDAWLEATIFGSSNVLDLSQQDFAYGGTNPLPCSDDVTTRGTSPTTGNSTTVTLYSCGEPELDDLRESLDRRAESADFIVDGQLRSQRIYDANLSVTDIDEARAGDFRFEQIRRAYRENLVGGNVTLHYTDAFQWGVTSYVGQTRFQLDDEGNPNFAYSNSAGFPRQELGDYGATGTHMRLVGDRFDVGAEYAYTFAGNGGSGFLLRANVEPLDWLEVQSYARVYGASFINPRANPRAAQDEVFGLAARNERGIQVQLLARPVSRLRLRTTVDYWQNPDQVFITPDGVVTFPRNQLLDDLYLQQRVEYAVTSRERVFLTGEFQDRVVRSLDANDSRYATGGDTCAPDILRSDSNALGNESDCAIGQRYKFSLGLTTTRIPRLSLYGRVDQLWQNDGEVMGDGDATATSDPTKSVSYRFVFRARAQPWEGGSLVLNLTWRPEDTFGLGVDDSSEFLIADSGPSQFFYLEAQQAWGGLRVKARYGFQDYLRNDPDRDLDRYNTYHVGRLAVEFRF